MGSESRTPTIFVGKGILQDYVEAHEWFNLAAEAGIARAAGSRDAVARMMPKKQIAAAQELARDWAQRRIQ